jgi:hypothetical protein
LKYKFDVLFGFSLICKLIINEHFPNLIMLGESYEEMIIEAVNISEEDCNKLENLMAEE